MPQQQRQWRQQRVVVLLATIACLLALSAVSSVSAEAAAADAAEGKSRAQQPAASHAPVKVAGTAGADDLIIIIHDGAKNLHKNKSSSSSQTPYSAGKKAAAPAKGSKQLVFDSLEDLKKAAGKEQPAYDSLDLDGGDDAAEGGDSSSSQKSEYAEQPYSGSSTDDSGEDSDSPAPPAKKHAHKRSSKDAPAAEDYAKEPEASDDDEDSSSDEEKSQKYYRKDNSDADSKPSHSKGSGGHTKLQPEHKQQKGHKQHPDSSDDDHQEPEPHDKEYHNSDKDDDEPDTDSSSSGGGKHKSQEDSSSGYERSSDSSDKRDSAYSHKNERDEEDEHHHQSHKPDAAYGGSRDDDDDHKGRDAHERRDSYHSHDAGGDDAYGHGKDDADGEGGAYGHNADDHNRHHNPYLEGPGYGKDAPGLEEPGPYYSEPKLHSTCLQVVDSLDPQPGDPAGSVRYSFRCCNERDDPKSCINPETPYDSYGSHHGVGSNWLFTVYDTVRNTEPAGTCFLAPVSEPCPYYTSGVCQTYRGSCTLSRLGAECGCPSRNGFTMDVEAYAHNVAGLSCSSLFTMSNTLPIRTTQQQNSLIQLRSGGALGATAARPSIARSAHRGLQQALDDAPYMGVATVVQGIGVGTQSDITGTLTFIAKFGVPSRVQPRLSLGRAIPHSASSNSRRLSIRDIVEMPAAAASVSIASIGAVETAKVTVALPPTRSRARQLPTLFTEAPSAPLPLPDLPFFMGGRMIITWSS